LQLFPNSVGEHEGTKLLPQPSITSLFTAISSGAVDLSIIPLENSTNGPVAQTLSLIGSSSESQRLEVCGETSVRVRHCLAGRRRSWRSETNSKSKLVNGAHEAISNGSEQDLSYITSLHTHPQAWSQCTPFLTRHFGSNISRQDEDSTSGSAEIVSYDQTGTSAAICSRLAADLYGLDVLADGIQSDTANETRFLVLRRREHPTDIPILTTTVESPGHWNGLLTCSLKDIKSKATIEIVVAAAQMYGTKIFLAYDTREWAFVFAHGGNDMHPRMLQLKQSLQISGVEAWDWSTWTGV
jgi:prephenate dehydratase